MPPSTTIMSLHLRYRLWIAEMNYDINILRIFDDYITELRAKHKEPEIRTKTDYFEHQFKKIRGQIDELRHELHIGKMKLGAFLRDGKKFDFKSYNKESHNPLKKKLAEYKTYFKNVNTEFCNSKDGWLA